MEEFLRVSIFAPDSKMVAFKQFVAEVSQMGFSVRNGLVPDGHSFDILVPPSDRRWKGKVLAGVAAGAVREKWSANWFEQIYSAEDIAAAPAFSAVHNGRCINFDTNRESIARVYHIADIDDTAACPLCGAGACQKGPLKLLGSELNKAGRLASIWIGANAFWMVCDSLLKQMQGACGEELSYRPVTTIGTAKANERWWQLDPQWAPPVQHVTYRHYKPVLCKDCDAVRLAQKSKAFSAPCYSIRKRAIPKSGLPPLLLGPIYGGVLERATDGRPQNFPARPLWFRGDLGRFLMTAKLPRLYLTPVLPA